MGRPADQRRRVVSAPRSSRRAAAVLVLVTSWLLSTGVGEAPARRLSAATEYEVKAALLLNFARFTEWPTHAFPDEASPLVVGILGDDPFGSTLDSTFRDETVRGRSLHIVRSRLVEDLGSAHVLFVCRSERDRLSEILASVSGSSMLTVGEIDDFARRGGIVNFYIEEHKVRFEINAAAAERKGLKLSSQLLRRARIIGPAPSRRGE